MKIIHIQLNLCEDGYGKSNDANLSSHCAVY